MSFDHVPAKRQEKAPEIPKEQRAMLCPSAYGCRPSRGEWLAAFLLVLLRQRWVVAFLAAAVAFTLLTLFLPGLLRARTPASGVPGNRSGLASRAPYLEKAFRLRAAGDLYSEDNRQKRAHDLYRRAQAACRTHLEGETNAALRLQVELGVAVLQEKAGDADGATATLLKVISGAAGAPVTGVAHFYLGRIYEIAQKDPGRALEQYEAALKYVTDTSPLDAMALACDLLTETGGGSRTAYGIAGLTATHASAAALEGDISESIRRVSGKKPDKNRDGAAPSGTAPAAGKTPQAEAEDPLVIVLGK